jgi:hypothetical protein
MIGAAVRLLGLVGQDCILLAGFQPACSNRVTQLEERR